MNTKIYSVFPACGKTWLAEHQEELGVKILDSDSSSFSWILNDEGNRVRNPEFPSNYIQHIKEAIGKYDCIFVSSHESVREALANEGIDFTIVYPESELLEEWVGRCYLREIQSKNGFPIKVLIENWDKWLSDCFMEGIDHDEIVLEAGQHLSDVINFYNIR